MSRLLIIIASMLIVGCSTAVKMESAPSLSKQQAIVFGKVNVIVDGKPVKLTTSGFKSYLTIEFRREASSTIMEYKVGETGYFFWSLPPGEYEVLGTYGFSADVGVFDSMIPLAQPVWIPFTVTSGLENSYLGDLTLELNKNGQGEQHLDDHYSAAIKVFHKRYPEVESEPQNKVSKLEPLNPGSYSKVTYLCSAVWGGSCSSGLTGVRPLYPDRLQGAVVADMAPILRWQPSAISDVEYDVVIYEAYDSIWRKINLDLMTGKKRWRRGKLLSYAQGLTEPSFKPDVILQPNSTYLWSVRLRRGNSVSTWSQVRNTQIHPFTFWYFMVEQWETWLDFTTPGK